MLSPGCCSTFILGALLFTTGALAGDVRPQDPKDSCDLVRNLPTGEDQCTYAKEHCASDSLIQYEQLYYCHVRPSGRAAEIVYQVCAICLLLLIFRLLGSTADEFFSPILTQISQDLGLPPRFAGVTLLALGNGAPDLVSSIAFVRAGQYRVAISGLLGGGMFVGAAVAGVVISTAKGVKARGALVRDISCYLVAVAAVAIILRGGRFTWVLAVMLLVMYLLFVAAVLAADIIHIWQSKTRDQGDPERMAEQQAPLLGPEPSHPPQADLSHLAQQHPSRNPSRAASLEMTEGRHSHGHDLSDVLGETSGTRSASGGRDSAWSAEGTQLTYSEKVHMSGLAYREMALAEMAHSTTFFGNTGLDRARRLALLPEGEDGEAEQSGYVPPMGEADVEAQTPHRLQEGDATSHIPQASASGRAAESAEEERQARVRQWCAGQDSRQDSQQQGQRGQGAATTSGRPQLTAVASDNDIGALPSEEVGHHLKGDDS